MILVSFKVFYIVYRIHMFLFVLANYIGRILWYNKTTAQFFMIYLTNWAMSAQVRTSLTDLRFVLFFCPRSCTTCST